jgi:hypothetical protein
MYVTDTSGEEGRGPLLLLLLSQPLLSTAPARLAKRVRVKGFGRDIFISVLLIVEGKGAV